MRRAPTGDVLNASRRHRLGHVQGLHEPFLLIARVLNASRRHRLGHTSYTAANPQNIIVLNASRRHRLGHMPDAEKPARRL